MISEAVGKILGMAMAYFVSSLGLFLAYVNYRKRTLGAEKVMTPRAWTVLALVLLCIVGGVVVIAQLASPPAADRPESIAEVEPETVAPPAVAEPAVAEPAAAEPAPPESGARSAERSRWPLVGMVLPAAIFLIATWITVSLYRHFSRPAET